MKPGRLLSFTTVQSRNAEKGAWIYKVNKQNKNWLIAAAIAVVAIIVIMIVYWNNRSRTGGTGNNPLPDTNGTGINSAPEGGAGSTAEKNSTPGTQDNNNPAEYLKEQDLIMSEMMQEMDAVARTGNASAHFLKGMTPHHQSAIDMAESYLKYGGKNEELKQLANDIINAQTVEIEDMDAMLKRIEESGKTDVDKEEGYLKEYNKMMASHQHGGHSHHGTPADIDQAFAQGMIMHHQMAIDMSEAILGYTDEEDVRTLAQAIINAQKKEIEQMQDLMPGA